MYREEQTKIATVTCRGCQLMSWKWHMAWLWINSRHSLLQKMNIMDNFGISSVNIFFKRWNSYLGQTDILSTHLCQVLNLDLFLFVSMHIYLPNVCVCPWKPERVLDSLELELLVVVNGLIWGLGTKPRFSGRAADIFKHSGLSPDPRFWVELEEG